MELIRSKFQFFLVHANRVSWWLVGDWSPSLLCRAGLGYRYQPARCTWCGAVVSRSTGGGRRRRLSRCTYRRGERSAPRRTVWPCWTHCGRWYLAFGDRTPGECDSAAVLRGGEAVHGLWSHHCQVLTRSTAFNSDPDPQLQPFKPALTLILSPRLRNLTGGARLKSWTTKTDYDPELQSFHRTVRNVRRIA